MLFKKLITGIEITFQTGLHKHSVSILGLSTAIVEDTVRSIRCRMQYELLTSVHQGQLRLYMAFCLKLTYISLASHKEEFPEVYYIKSPWFNNMLTTQRN